MQYYNQYQMPQSPMPAPVYQQAAYSNTYPTEFYQLRPDDVVILYSLEKYMEKRGFTPETVRPDEYMRLYESTRDVFYSDIVQRLTRVIPYVNYADEDNEQAKALRNSLYHHMRNPYFLDLMMRQLYQENNLEANGFIGAFLCEAATAYYNEMKMKDELETSELKDKSKKDKGDKDEKTPPPKKSNFDENIMQQMYNAALSLLRGKFEYVKSQCVGMDSGDAIAVAAKLAMNNELTLKELIKSNLPLTADILQNDSKIGPYPQNIITAALHLKKADYAKLSVNQTKFVDSLTKWVYSTLERWGPMEALNFLTSAYRTSMPGDAVKDKLIQLKDCGTQYQNLLQVVRVMKLN